MATGTYNDVYSYWVTSDASYTTASSTTTTSDIWTGWTAATASSTTTTTTSNDYVWVRWTGELIQRPVSYAEETSQQRRARRDRERARERDNRRQQAAIRRQEEEQRKRYAAMEQKRAAAEKKAQQLLMDLIGPDQVDVYKKTGRLYVRGAQHDYILKKGGLVTQVGKEKVIDMCVHLAERTKYPETDNVVALKLMIEGGEEAQVIKLANFHRYSEKPRKEAALPLAACM